MNRQQAINFVKNSPAKFFIYPTGGEGYSGKKTPKAEAIRDIQSMDDETWGDGDIDIAKSETTLQKHPGILFRQLRINIVTSSARI